MLIPYKEILEKYNIKPTGVCHIGAHFSEEAKDYYDNGVERTIWVEAHPECIPYLINNLRDYPNHLIFNDCISDKDGDWVKFNISNNEGQSSSILELDYHKIAHPEVHYVTSMELQTKRLDTLFKENNLNIEEYEFLNADVQGAELLVLKSLGELLHKVKILYLEINFQHLYENCPLVEDIDAYVKDFGFERVETVECGSFQWGDAVYINKKNK